MKIQELLSSKDKWTREEFARNKDEGIVAPDSPDAVKWCLEGAIYKCYPSLFYEIRDKVRGIAQIDISEFNDSHSYDEVMELVRRLDL